MNLALLLCLLCGERVLSQSYNNAFSDSKTYETIDALYLNSTRASSSLGGRSGKFLWTYRPHYVFKYPDKKYDYIIVGAGVAGCVLANRLSENPAISVLLVEAGVAENPLATDIPLTASILQSTDYNYGYVTEPQKKACLGLKQNRCNWPHGRGLGGSSIISHLIYSRGSRQDYDAWSAAGNPGWSYDEILPYYKKIETSNIKDFQYNNYHGFNGPVSVEDVPFKTKIAKKFIKSAKALGYQYVDLNSEQPMGVSYVQQMTKMGKRVTAARSYLEPVAYRRNLHVLQNAKVTLIDVDKENQSATGVKLLLNNQEFRVAANREVILSAGSFESPRLLMLSGIGPADHLTTHNITVVKDLPVGSTLYDHVGVIGPIFVINKPIDNLYSLDHMINLSAFADLSAGQGVLTANGVESMLYMNTGLSNADGNGAPDIELDQKMVTVSFDTGPGLKLAYRLTDHIYDSVFRPLMNRRAFHVVPVLLQPKSKGYLRLRSNSAHDHPILEPNYFDDERDLDVLVAGIEEAIKIVSQKAFEKMGTQLYKANIPGCEGKQFGTRDYWRCYAMHMTTSLHAQVGVCKMGPESDPTAVVDHKLRVHGIKNLRVVDSGVIPSPPTGHIGVYTYLIGERAADFIKETWNQ